MNEWFQQLSGTMRVNVICDLLSCCSPVELCFFSTYLRDLCNFEEKLLPAREQANAFHIDKKLLSIFNSANVNELIITTALIDLTNTESASAVYDIVHRDLNALSFAYDSLLNNDTACEGVLQLLTLISNHPAFNFTQKSNLFEHILLLSKKCSIKSAEIILNGFSNILSITESNPAQLKTDEEKVSDLKKPLTSLLPNGNSLCLSGVSVPERSIPKSILQGKIKGIELRSSRKKKMFILETTWASSKRTEVFKSFKDVVDFHEKLLEFFPENYTCESPAAQIQNDSLANNAKDCQTMIVAEYFSNFLHQVPLQIKDSDIVLNFFKPPSNARPPPTLIGTSNLKLSISRNEDSKPELLTKDCNTSVPKNSTNCTKPTKVYNNCRVKSTKQKISVSKNKTLLPLPESHEQNELVNCASSVLSSPSRVQQNYKCAQTEKTAINYRNYQTRDVSSAVLHNSSKCNSQLERAQVLVKTNSANKHEQDLKSDSSKSHSRADTRKSRSLEILDDKSNVAYAYGPEASANRKEVIQKQEKVNRDRIFVKSAEYIMPTQGSTSHNFRENRSERSLDETSPTVVTPKHPSNARRQRSYRNANRWPQFMTASDFYYAAYNQLPPFSSKKPTSGFKYS